MEQCERVQTIHQAKCASKFNESMVEDMTPQMQWVPFYVMACSSRHDRRFEVLLQPVHGPSLPHVRFWGMVPPTTCMTETDVAIFGVPSPSFGRPGTLGRALESSRSETFWSQLGLLLMLGRFGIPIWELFGRLGPNKGIF